MHPMTKLVPTEVDCEQIARVFHLGSLLEVVKDLGGVFNVNRLIRTENGLFVIRVLSGYATSSHILFEQEMACKLRSRGIPTLSNCVREDGKPYMRWNGRKVQVTPFHQAYKFRGTKAEVESSGNMLRRFHHALRHVSDCPQPRWSNYPSRTRMEAGIDQLTRLYGVNEGRILHVGKFYEQASGRWSALCHHLPKTIVHGDWHPWNCLYEGDGTVALVHDFDFARRGYRVMDVAYALWTLKVLIDDPSLLPAFLSGYGGLEPSERKVLPWAMAQSALVSLTTASLQEEPQATFDFIYEREISFLQWVLNKQNRDLIRSLAKE